MRYPVSCTLCKLGMVLRLPTSGDLLYHRQLSQAHQLSSGGLSNKAAARPPADHPVDIFNQLLRKDYMSASRRQRLFSEGQCVLILSIFQGL
jgi:hypothetical protein